MERQPDMFSRTVACILAAATMIPATEPPKDGGPLPPAFQERLRQNPFAVPGPGGFYGGDGGDNTSRLPTAGFGPAGGTAGNPSGANCLAWASGGGFTANDFLVPLIGGSGGGGFFAPAPQMGRVVGRFDSFSPVQSRSPKRSRLEEEGLIGMVPEPEERYDWPLPESKGKVHYSRAARVGVAVRAPPKMAGYAWKRFSMRLMVGSMATRPPLLPTRPTYRHPRLQASAWSRWRVSP